MRLRKLFLLLTVIATISAGFAAGASTDPFDGAADVRLAAGTGSSGPVKFLVTYNPSITGGSKLADRIAQTGGSARVFTQFPVLTVMGDVRTISALASTPGVEVIEPVAEIAFDLNAGPHAIGADRVRAPKSAGGLGVNGSGVVVGVIDSGVDGRHPDLKNRLHRNVKIIGSELSVGEVRVPPTTVIDRSGDNGDTSSGHGTHVSGIISGDGTASGGLYTGVAPGAKVNGVGVGDVATIDYALEGYEYLLQHAAADNLVVINNSWGLNRQTATTDSSVNSVGTAIRTAMEAAMSQGVAIVHSAGNSGTNAAGTADNCAGTHSVINPYALVPGVISAAASSRDGAAIMPFSSCGRTSDTAHDPTITAPGGDIYAAKATNSFYVDTLQSNHFKDYVEASGTSMAAPHVAGAVALIQSARIQAGLAKLTPAELKSVLQGTAKLIQGVPSRKQGAGLIDVAAATAQAISVAAPATISTCSDVVDLSGDATQAIANTVVSNVPALDVVSASLRVDGADLVGTIKVTDLNLLDPGAVNGIYFDYNFTFATSTAAYTQAPPAPHIGYYLVANYSRAKVRATPSAAVNTLTFGLGKYGTLRESLTAGTGAFDEANDTVTIRVPLTKLKADGSVLYDLTGRTLHTGNVVSRRDLHNIIADADTAYGQAPYVVGAAC